MSYYFYYNEDVVGPYTKDQMLEMLKTGILDSKTLTMPDGGTDWVSLSSIEDLSGSELSVPKKAPARNVIEPKGDIPALANKANPAKKTGISDSKTDSQREVYEAAMAKKHFTNGSKIKMLLIGLAVLVALSGIGFVLSYFEIIQI